MLRYVMALALLCAACGDNRHAIVVFDAPTDAPLDADDACVPFLADANEGCCALYPDDDAIRACAAPTFAVGSCGVLACREIGTCAFHRVDVCNLPPPDAGVDA